MADATHERLADLAELSVLDRAYLDRLIVHAHDRVGGHVRAALFPHEIEQQDVDPRVLEQLDLIVDLD